MDGGVADPGCLVECFAEFPLLPDLVQAYATTEDWPPEWGRLLDENRYNTSHVEDHEIPSDMTLTQFTTEDAFQLCERIGIIGPRGGLSAVGRRLANIAATPFDERGPREMSLLTKILAVQIHANYRGEYGMPLTDMVQAASAVLASHGYTWPRGLDGLLLVELDSLLHWGSINAAAAERLVHRLPEIRFEVIRALRQLPEPADRQAIDPPLVSELVAEVHWSRPDLAQGSPLTVTGLRATAMALTFSQLVAQTLKTLPLQVLRPWLRA